MTPRLILAAAVLLAVPCAYSQDAPAPPSSTSAPGQISKVTVRRAPGGPGGDAHSFEVHGGQVRVNEVRHGEMHGGGEMHDREMSGMAGGGMPPGTWWRNPETISRLTLTSDQQKRIDDLFLQSRVQLIDLHASLEKEQLMLEPLLNANPVDQGKAMAQISKIADTRADLEKTDAKMLLGIRAVLSADQWTKLREVHRIFIRGGGPGGPGGPGEGVKVHMFKNTPGGPMPMAPAPPQ